MAIVPKLSRDKVRSVLEIGAAGFRHGKYTVTQHARCDKIISVVVNVLPHRATTLYNAYLLYN